MKIVEKIILVLLATGFIGFGILTEFTKDYNLGLALGFLIGVCEVLFVFMLAKHFESKRYKRD